VWVDELGIDFFAIFSCKFNRQIDKFRIPFEKKRFLTIAKIFFSDFVFTWDTIVHEWQALAEVSRHALAEQVLSQYLGHYKAQQSTLTN
jgi:hypothetical protein